MLRQSKGGWNINSQKIVLTNGGGIVYSTTKGEKGTGLGLYMSKIIVEKMGGEIAIYDNPDRGATVEITI